jgi:hypothetical protein
MQRLTGWLLVSVLVAGLRTPQTVSAQTQTPAGDAPNFSPGESGVDLRGVFMDSLKLLVVQHATRIALQEKTRRELGGPFWEDYVRSVRMPQQWGDTDSWTTNDIGHPIQGAASGYIWLDHERGAPVTFMNTSNYWASRGRAAAWAAIYSLQFEIGPISEASIGNVGFNKKTAGWTDYLITPTGAFAMIVIEDSLDKFLVKWFETRTSNKALRATMRTVLNPSRSLSNGVTGRALWYRQGRPLDWRPNPAAPSGPGR